eukprot:1192909-Prorocentrum_minimum.AAC.2
MNRVDVKSNLAVLTESEPNADRLFEIRFGNVSLTFDARLHSALESSYERGTLPVHPGVARVPCGAALARSRRVLHPPRALLPHPPQPARLRQPRQHAPPPSQPPLPRSLSPLSGGPPAGGAGRGGGALADAARHHARAHPRRGAAGPGEQTRRDGLPRPGCAPPLGPPMGPPPWSPPWNPPLRNPLWDPPPLPLGRLGALRRGSSYDFAGHMAECTCITFVRWQVPRRFRRPFSVAAPCRAVQSCSERERCIGATHTPALA